jgi:hypothetical protein
VTWVYRWGGAVIIGAWTWIALVLAVTFWRVWEIPKRLPEINEIATAHLFLFPLSLILFLTLSWVRQQGDLVPEGRRRSYPRWQATLALVLLAFLHPVSCVLYPAVFNLDTRTVDAVAAAVRHMQVGMPRYDVHRGIVALNNGLPISMGTNASDHQKHQKQVEAYLTASDADRQRLWAELSRATLVFVPVGIDRKPPAREAREEVFQRTVRTSSDIGADRLTLRYGPTGRLEEVIYSSNRQLTEVTAPCTIHIIVPASPDTSFPYPCPSR